MTLTIEVPAGVAGRLEAQAASSGLSLERYAAQLLESSAPAISLDDAIRLHAAGKVSQGQGAALAGVSRAEFLDALSRAGITPFQYTAEEIIEEVVRA